MQIGMLGLCKLKCCVSFRTWFLSVPCSPGHGEYLGGRWLGVCQPGRPAELRHQDSRPGGEGHSLPDVGEWSEDIVLVDLVDLDQRS